MKKKSRLFFRRFGFELEFSTPFTKSQKTVKKIISKIYGSKMIESNDYLGGNDRRFRKWEFKVDGSTESELTTPISTIYSFPKIEETLKALKEADMKITKKDSVHVHMQANDVPRHNIIAAWIQIENTIMKCFPSHRRNNGYCQKLIHAKKYRKVSDFFLDAEDESGDHHAMISLSYYAERRTVEFRIMEGGLDIKNIKPWVKFCMLFLNYAKTVDPVEIVCNKIKTNLKIEEMIEMLNIHDKEVIEFLERRSKQFRK